MRTKKKKIQKQFFVLDVAIWARATRLTPYGRASTADFGTSELLNSKGNKCCLGQWLSQCGVPDERLIGNSSPSDLDESPGIRHRLFSIRHRLFSIYSIDDTRFSNRAMEINDNMGTDDIEKIKLLRELLKKKGITLRVKNKNLAINHSRKQPKCV